MQQEEMTSFGVPVDAGIIDYIEDINSLPKINTTYSCSGMQKDHTGDYGRPYIVIQTNSYVGKDLLDMPKYPHETHRRSLKVYRAAVMAGWYASFTTTDHKGVGGISAVRASTQPLETEYHRILAGNVTGNPTKTKVMRKRTEEALDYEREKHFVSDSSDEIIEAKWKRLYDELHWELVERKDAEPR